MQHLASCQSGEKAKQSQAAGTLCMVLLCSALRSDKQIALAQISKTYLQNLVLSWPVSAPSKNRSIQIRKTYSQNLSWLGQSNIEHRQIWYKCTWFKDSFYLACLFDIFSWCMRCSLRGIVKQQRIGCFLFSFKHLKSLPRFWLCRCLLITRQQRSGRSFDKKYKVWPLAATHLSE